MMKKTFYLFFVLILSANLSAQEITTDLFSHQFSGSWSWINSMNFYDVLDQFVGGQVGAFIEVDGETTCVGLATIQLGYTAFTVSGINP
nr:hypothetical protein [SAR86 cluster bacterium]